MFQRPVPKTLPELLAVLTVCNFPTEEDFDNFIRSFFNQMHGIMYNDIMQKIERLEKIKKFNAGIEEKLEFENLMDEIDQVILENRGIIDKIKKKYKYKGRYNYGSTKGKTSGNKSKINQRHKTAEQFRIMFEDKK